MCKVKAELVLVAERAALLALDTERVAQGQVEHVRARVVLGDEGAARVVDNTADSRARREVPRGTAANVEHVGAELLHVLDAKAEAALGADGPNVTHLPASLGVEGGALKDESDKIGRPVHRLEPSLLPIDDRLERRAEGGAAPRRRVPCILGLIVRRRDAHLILERVRLLGLEYDGLLVAKVAAGARLLLGGLHLGLEGCRVNGETLFLAHEQGEVHWEAERVVHLEGVCTGENATG